MTFLYRTTGVCPSAIRIELDGDTIRDVRFQGGCDGNTQGIARLVRGRNAREVIILLQGVHCNGKETSCPDQLARALTAALDIRYETREAQ